MKYEYSHYIFDLDGAIANTLKGVVSSYRYALEKLCLVLPDDELMCLIDDTMNNIFLNRFSLTEETLIDAVKSCKQYYAEKGIYESTLYSGIEEVFGHLEKKGCRISVVTLRRTDFARRLLKKFGIANYIHAIQGMDARETFSKADLVKQCLDKVHLRPIQTIYIGDSVADLCVAKDCGISFLGAGYGFGGVNESLHESNPSYGIWGCADTPMDLLDKLVYEIPEMDVEPPVVSQSGPVEVSVVLITYNHTSYIRQCIDSILMQQTNYRFEILIGDDASPDDTQDILWEYQNLYPEIIRLEARETNIGATSNAYDLYRKAKGRYIALMEGDDYWTDVLKLQLQYEFLEENHQYIGCGHDTQWVNADCIPSGTKTPWGEYEPVFTLANIKSGIYPPDILPSDTASWFFRNIFFTPKYDYTIYETAHNLIGDHTLMLLLTLQGDFYRIKKILGHHRWINSVDGTNAVSQEYQKKFMAYEWFVYFCVLEKYAKKEFSHCLYYSIKILWFERFIQTNISSLSYRTRQHLKQMFFLSDKTFKYRIMKRTFTKYMQYILKSGFSIPKRVLKKIRNRHHAYLVKLVQDTQYTTQTAINLGVQARDSVSALALQINQLQEEIEACITTSE